MLSADIIAKQVAWHPSIVCSTLLSATFVSILVSFLFHASASATTLVSEDFDGPISDRKIKIHTGDVKCGPLRTVNQVFKNMTTGPTLAFVRDPSDISIASDPKNPTNKVFKVRSSDGWWPGNCKKRSEVYFYSGGASVGEGTTRTYSMRFYPVGQVKAETRISQWHDLGGKWPYIQLIGNSVGSGNKVLVLILVKDPNGKRDWKGTQITTKSFTLKGTAKGNAWNTVTVQITLGSNGRIRAFLNGGPAAEYNGQTVWDKNAPRDPGYRLGVYGRGIIYFDDIVITSGTDAPLLRSSSSTNAVLPPSR